MVIDICKVTNDHTKIMTYLKASNKIRESCPSQKDEVLEELIRKWLLRFKIEKKIIITQASNKMV